MSVNQQRRRGDVARKRPHRRTTPLSRREENEAIRQAVLKAVPKEEAKRAFNLSGRGHEPRVTLCPSMAAILRGMPIPCAYISGYGANSHYPARVFATACSILTKSLGSSPVGMGHSGAYRQHRPEPDASAAPSPAAKVIAATSLILLELPDKSRVTLDARTFRFQSGWDGPAAGELEIKTAVTDASQPLPMAVDFQKLADCLQSPRLPFSECFRRIAPERYSPIYSLHQFHVRFISTLYDFRGTYQGGTFCPSMTEWNFLDGGISSQSGYGSSSSWTVVRGTEALRVICLFHGIEQPKRLLGETNRRPLG